MLKLTTTSYLHLFNTLNFNIFVHKSRSNARGIQLVNIKDCSVEQPKCYWAEINFACPQTTFKRWIGKM